MEQIIALNEKQAARYLGLARQSLANRRHKGLPPVYVKIGARIIYLVADLHDFLKKHRVDREGKEAG